jgi:hypothetical protein
MIHLKGRAGKNTPKISSSLQNPDQKNQEKKLDKNWERDKLFPHDSFHQSFPIHRGLKGERSEKFSPVRGTQKSVWVKIQNRKGGMPWVSVLPRTAVLY